MVHIKKVKKYDLVVKVLEVLLVVSTLVSPIFLNGLGAYGIVSNANENLANSADLLEYYVNLMHQMLEYGYLMVASSVLMVVSLVLCLVGLDVVPMVTQSAGFTICMVVMYKISAIADKYGLTDSEMQPLSEKYFNRHFVTLVPFLLLLAVCLMRFFSYDKRSQRRQKRLDRLAKDNAPCEKIID